MPPLDIVPSHLTPGVDEIDTAAGATPTEFAINLDSQNGQTVTVPPGALIAVPQPADQSVGPWTITISGGSWLTPATSDQIASMAASTDTSTDTYFYAGETQSNDTALITATRAPGQFQQETQWVSLALGAPSISAPSPSSSPTILHVIPGLTDTNSAVSMTPGFTEVTTNLAHAPGYVPPPATPTPGVAPFVINLVSGSGHTWDVTDGTNLSITLPPSDPRGTWKYSITSQDWLPLSAPANGAITGVVGYHVGLSPLDPASVQAMLVDPVTGQQILSYEIQLDLQTTADTATAAPAASSSTGLLVAAGAVGIGALLLMRA